MASEIVEPRTYRADNRPVVVMVVLSACCAFVVYWATRSDMLLYAILATEIPMVAYLWSTQVQVTVDRNGIEWRRHGRTVVIPWAQVRQVQTGPDGLTISDGFQSIRIQRGYSWFDEFRQTLRRNAPQEAVEAATRFPFTVRASKMRWIAIGAVLGMAAIMAAFTAWKTGDTIIPLSLLVVSTPLVIMMCFVPTRYEFTRQGLETIAPWRRKTYLWSDFETVAYFYAQGQLVTTLKFSSGSVGFSEMSISTPPERIIESLKEELGPQYREEPELVNPRLTKA